MTDTLQHHGVLGMKWGKHIRGGSKTPSTRVVNSAAKRASKVIDKTSAQKEANLAIQRKKEYHNRGKLTDAQLNKRVNRLQQEQRYKELVNQPFAEAKSAQKARRNKRLKIAAGTAAAIPFAMINTTAGGGKYKVALSLLKYGVPAMATAMNAVAGGGGGGKKKKH